MKLLFKFPTRGRPKKFVEVLDKYYAMMSGKHPFEFVISMDEDDDTMNTSAMRGFLNLHKNLKYFYGKSRTKIEAVNADMADLDFDVLILVSDDMIPLQPKYDDFIVRAMKEFYPNLDGAVHFHDGCRPIDDNLITMTMMGRKLYEYFGYIYYPEYKSYWCDNEFTRVVEKLNKVEHIPFTIIRHFWKGDYRDATFYKNHQFADFDHKLFIARMAKGFPK